jgi:predicted  nucleic acid-binding Zn-ribbon protein
MNIKHSKYKNTGILFELLVRQITADTLSGKDSKATHILKKYFVKTELGREYKLYETLTKHKHLTEGKAEVVINSVIESSKNLNRGALKRQKYNLIQEISKYYNLEEFFNTKLSNYKSYAALYTLVEIYNSELLSTPDQIISNKIAILENLTTKQVNKQKVEDDLLTEFQSYDKDLRILTYRVMLEKFNGKYSTLNDNQKLVLKEFINSVDSTPKLRDFYNTKIVEIKEEIHKLSKKVTDKVIQIKLNEVKNLLSPLGKTSNVGNDDLVNLLQYYELLEELVKTNG